MPCALTRGFTPDCKVTGGVEEIKIKVMPSAWTDFTVNTDGSAAIAVGSETGWYTYKFTKENGVITEKLVGNVENQTVHYEQTLTFSIFQLSKDKQVEFLNLAKNRIIVAIKTNEGTSWLMGYNLGADVTEINATTGKALSDKNGYDFTIVAKSPIHLLDITTEYANLTM